MDHQKMLHLIGPTEDPCQLTGSAYNEEVMAAIHIKAGDRTAMFSLNARCALLSYCFGNYPKALVRTEKAKRDIESIVGIVEYAIFYYYDSLIRLAICRDASWREKKSLLRNVVLNQRKLKKWAQFCPENHWHRYLAVEAEIACQRGDEARARKLFREALESANRYGWTLDHNMILEAFARFWFECGEVETGEFYTRQARDGYQKWGAYSLAQKLEKQHLFLKLSPLADSRPPGLFADGAREKQSDSYDWTTIIKASQTISSEIILSRLLKKLMELLVESAGARKGYVILETDGKLTIEARNNIKTGVVSVQEGIPVEDSDELSQGIVQYVCRKKEPVLLNSAPYNGLFGSDPYLQKNRPRSLLCSPILSQEHLLAILYLENDLVANAFSHERLELINLLSSQIAISLDHAVLFDKMNQAKQHLKVQNEAMEFMIEKLKKTYAELNEANEKKELIRKHLQNIIDSMPSSLIGVDMENIIDLWNSEACAELGVSYASARGKLLWDIIPFFADQRESLQTAIEDKSPQKLERVMGVTDKDGEYYDITIYPLITPQPTGVVIRIDNVTSRVQIEALMIQTEKMMSIGGLAAGMAHEINNPLNAIVMNAHNVSKLLSTELQRNEIAAKKIGIEISKVNQYAAENSIIDMLNDIMEMGGRASKIIENTLHYSRKSDSEKVPENLPKLIEESIELAAKDYNLKKKYDFRKVKIEKEWDEEIELVPCIATEVVQVVLNLIRNGVQAMMAQESPQDAPRIKIRLCRDGHFAKITIEDNGPGMDKDIIQRVFDPFFTTKEAGVGTGLGLSVSHYIVTENHKGKIEVESQKGEGCCFSVYLPLGNE